jgi:hypothetical protein
MSSAENSPLINDALKALKLDAAAKKRGIIELRHNLKTGKIPHHEGRKLLSQIEQDPGVALESIRMLWDGKPVPEVRKWLEPIWHTAQAAYCEAVVRGTAEGLRKAHAAEKEAPRVKELAKALEKIAAQADALQKSLCRLERTPHAARVLEGAIREELGTRCYAETTKTRRNDGSILTRTRVLISPEQTLVGLWPQPLRQALTDLSRVANERATKEDMTDGGGSRTARDLSQPCAKRHPAIDGAGLFRAVNGTLPTPRELGGLIEPIWNLANVGDSDSDLSRPIKEALAAYKRNNYSEGNPDDLVLCLRQMVQAGA